MRLAQQVRELSFTHPVSPERAEELVRRAFDKNTPLHGYLSVAFADAAGAKIHTGGFTVRTRLNGRYVMLGYFNRNRAIDAMRYADMATIYFAKYKSSRGASEKFLNSNRGKLDHIFNTSEAEAYSDMERESRMKLQLEGSELAAKEYGLITDHPVADTYKSGVSGVASDLALFKQEIAEKFEEIAVELFKLQSK